jgi:2-dehydro-3-deoxyphosphogluconate aldolase/(4S)-4-hydroxy-2-oxoglutarate aldolase
MKKKETILSQVIEQGILPLYFHQDAEVSVQILKALYNAGIRVAEYTNRGETALDNFQQLRKITDRELPGLQLGIGTIRNKIQATEFINLGADFIVCPGVIEAVAGLADDNDLLWIPGCLTATEIIVADDLGAALIKLFPANLLGPSYITAIKDVFPHLLFMPTGGIDADEEDLGKWFSSGASAVGLGSKLVSKNLVEAKNYSGIQLSAKQTLEIAKKFKSI